MWSYVMNVVYTYLSLHLTLLNHPSVGPRLSRYMLAINLIKNIDLSSPTQQPCSLLPTRIYSIWYIFNQLFPIILILWAFHRSIPVVL